jgi:hypothetical protein
MTPIHPNRLRISDFGFRIFGAGKTVGLFEAGYPRLGKFGITNAALPPPRRDFSLWGFVATVPRGVLSYGLLAVSVSCGYYEGSNWRDHAV